MVAARKTLTIQDLNNELKNHLKFSSDEKSLTRLEKLKINREKQKKFNREQAAVKRRLTKEISKTLSKTTEQQLEKKKQQLRKFDLSIIDNEINMIVKKDFKYNVVDDFGYKYKLSSKVVKKMLLNEETKVSPAEFILKRFKTRVNKEIATAKKNKEYLKITALERLEEKVDLNLKEIKTGKHKEREEYKTVKFKGTKQEIDFTVEKYKKKGAYIKSKPKKVGNLWETEITVSQTAGLVLIDFVGDIIAINI